MASAMVSAASRSIPPPYTIPVGPRVRPPRLLPGTKAANTNPRPLEPPPVPGHVWVQGKWRDPGSNAAKDRRQLESTRAEKALRQVTHGMNIYAYSHIRTNQVVYSLSRVMQNNKILEQLIFHGKQTVPSALRRDMWRPYFSMHFDKTPAGAEAGLKAYRRLRELSIQRQLSPPIELITATEADVQKRESQFKPHELKRRKEEGYLKNMPVKNQTLPKKLRARKLMDQKATSVADAALVVSLMNEDLNPVEALDAAYERKEIKHQEWSTRALNRLQAIKEKEAVKDVQIATRRETVEASDGQLGLTPHAANRIAIEHGGAVRLPWKGMEHQVQSLDELKKQQQNAPSHRLSGEQRPSEFDAERYKSQYIESWKEQNEGKPEGPSEEVIKTAISEEQARVDSQITAYQSRLAAANGLTVSEMEERNARSRNVEILWADIRDATWAEKWTTNVYHGELESRAALKHEKVLSRQQKTIDEHGNKVLVPQKKVLIQNSSTPHVFGVDSTDSTQPWYQTPERLAEQQRKWREDKAAAWKEEKLQLSKRIVEDMIKAYQNKTKLQTNVSGTYPGIDTASHKDDIVVEDKIINTEAEAAEYDLRTAKAKAKNNVVQANTQLEALGKAYPSLYQKFSEVLQWREGLETYTVLAEIKNELGDLKSTYDNQHHKISTRLQKIDTILTSHASKQERLRNIASSTNKKISLESDLMSSIAKSNQRITQIRKRITALEATNPQSTELNELRDSLENEQDLIVTSRDSAWSSRIHAVEDTLSAISRSDEYRETGVIDLIEQCAFAKKNGDTTTVKSLTKELKEREDDVLAVLLGLESKFQPQIHNMNDELRERPRERKVAPEEEKQGAWGRFKGWFGR